MVYLKNGQAQAQRPFEWPLSQLRQLLAGQAASHPIPSHWRQPGFLKLGKCSSQLRFRDGRPTVASFRPSEMSAPRIAETYSQPFLVASCRNEVTRTQRGLRAVTFHEPEDMTTPMGLLERCELALQGGDYFIMPLLGNRDSASR